MSEIVDCFDWPILRVFLGSVVFPARYFVSLSRLLCCTGAFMLVPIILLVGVAQVSFGKVACRASRVKRFWKCNFGRASGESTFCDLAWTDLETRFVVSVFLPSGAGAQDTIVRCTSP